MLTVYIKTFNAQFLKQKQPQNSRQHRCSFCGKGHSAGTKSTSISLIVATGEDILLPNATYSHIPYFSSLILGLHTHCPHPGPHLPPTRVSGAMSFLVLFFFQIVTSPVSHPPSQWKKKPSVLPFAQIGPHSSA